ncbi:MAG TPA: hypothetical protein PLW09_16400 [Candidatus Kapabacteria bacterium]|nr:hypothetical protein [Candidatus Kapabacteria bacterium]
MHRYGLIRKNSSTIVADSPNDGGADGTPSMGLFFYFFLLANVVVVILNCQFLAF